MGWILILEWGTLIEYVGFEGSPYQLKWDLVSAYVPFYGIEFFDLIQENT